MRTNILTVLIGILIGKVLLELARFIRKKINKKRKTERDIIMIKGKTKYYTEIQVLGGNIIRICNRNKGSSFFPGNPQIHLVDENGFSMCTNLSDEQIDTLIEVLQSAKKMVKE